MLLSTQRYERFKSQQQYYVSFQCNSIIQQIEIVNEHVTITESNSSSFILTNTKAIIIHLSGGKLILEKDCVWSEFWYISLLNAEDEYTFYNQWDEKADDDKTTYQVTLERYFI